MEHRKTTIYVVTHKKCQLPELDKCYQPILVGADMADEDTLKYALVHRWQTDNTGDNISRKNGDYCELTGLYWMWKNSDSDIVGLCHYRRYFSTVTGKVKNFMSGKVEDIYTEDKIKKYMSKYDIIMHNRTYIKSNVYQQYADNHDVVYMERIRQIIERQCPEYISSFEQVMSGKSLHFLNMFITRKEMMDSYCEWLFGILTELENINWQEDRTCPRLYGFLSERLFDVWVRYNRLKIKEAFTVNTERVDRRILI